MFTATQEKQFKFLRAMGDREIQQDARGSYALFHYSLSCKTCNESKELHTANGCESWLSMHQGHRTWIEFMGKTR